MKKWEFLGESVTLLTIFRSEKMELYRLTIPKDEAWKVIESLGNKNVAHFVDLNKQEQLFNLPYAFRLKMCDETERRINYLINKSKELKITVVRPKMNETAETVYERFAEFIQGIEAIAADRRKAMHLLFDTIEQDI